MCRKNYGPLTRSDIGCSGRQTSKTPSSLYDVDRVSILKCTTPSVEMKNLTSKNMPNVRAQAEGIGRIVGLYDLSLKLEFLFLQSREKGLLDQVLY